ncbi:MAG: GspE/PulE family protein [Desulfobacterium sp.]|jgi:general secretion pathway protein E|nr:GspE/PulE family protein [Desulfobacterium sp.]
MMDQDDQDRSRNICKILVDQGLISREQARGILAREAEAAAALEAKRVEKRKKDPAGAVIEAPIGFMDILVAFKITRRDDSSKKLDEDTLYEAVARGFGMVYKKIDPLSLDLNLVTRTIPRSFAMKHLVLPLGMDEGRLLVATSDFFNFDAIDDVERVSNFKVQPVISSKSDIIRLIDEFFGFRHSISAAEHQFAGKGVDLGNLEQYVRLKSMDELPSTDQHIVNAVNHLFSYAFDQRASDIHIEPKRETSLVRMRIDGILHTAFKLPKKVHNAVISRIKTLSRLNMAEKRRPQDGRIKTEKGGREVEIRVSTIPVAFGEKVVMRIMDPDVLLQDLSMLGFVDRDLERFKAIVTRPHGIVLVTGPTGSGKSTTLYSTLRMLSNPGVNIVTIEEPIEMIHEDFNQISVQPSIGVTFDSILRNILRQDPDIIMVGEIRDLETAQSAVQAALTGHLVLSTLHTNDAVTSVTRLLDLGIPPFLIHSSLVGVVAQRLLRSICPHCISDITMDAAELRDMGLPLDVEGDVALKYGKGCVKCRNTGYRGRQAVFEVLPYTESLKKMTARDASVPSLRKRARMEGLVTLQENAVRAMLSGRTTFGEVLRVTSSQD